MRVLFLDLDTLRPDHLGCYGYHRNTSPCIDAIAREGTRFTDYYCSDAPCLPSRMALMSGRFGFHTGVVGHGGTAADPRLEGINRPFTREYNKDCLPGIFRREGMRTVSVSPFAERHSAYSFYAGFTEIYNTGNCGNESAEEITPTVLDWIERNAEQDNWFLHVNYWDAHTPYRAPESFGNPFADDPIDGWITEDVLRQHLSMVGPHTAREINMYDNRQSPYHPRYPGEILDMDGLRRMMDGYDCGIRYMDSHIGKIMEALQQKGVADDLAVIITADHAENMGELGIYGEHATADYANCRIPMIVKWPGMRKGAVDTGLHYNLDLCPTLADLLHVEHGRRWDGQSYAAALSEGADCGREYLVLGQCCHLCQRGVRFGDYLYLRTYHDGYHLLNREMLFDVRRDPHEQTDLAPTHRELCDRGASLLLDWMDDMMRTNDSAVDPLWTVMKERGPFHTWNHLPAYVKRLEETGRAEGAARLRAKYPEEFAK